MNTTVNEIDHIKEMLSMLPETALHELRTFAAYLADRERRRKELVERVLKAEQEHDSIICNSVEDAMQTIYNTPDNDDEKA
jgi:lauroyl/myristoyl acyltransferase